MNDVYTLERIQNFKELVRKYFDRKNYCANCDKGFADESVFILKNI